MRVSNTAKSAVQVWPCTLTTNPALSKHQDACSDPPFWNVSRFLTVCALPFRPRGRSNACVPPLGHVTDSYFYICSTDMAGSGAHGAAFVLSFSSLRSPESYLPAGSLNLILLCSSVVVGWFFTSTSLMEGKDTSGVASTLSAVRTSLLPNRS